jgi:uncharacterized protein YegL
MVTRRLPAFFLVDISESMVGEPLQAMDNGIRGIVQDLKTDPYALETVYLSIIVYAGKPKTLVPLTSIEDFLMPQLFVSGGSALGKAMVYLSEQITTSVIATTPNRRGDARPIVFIFTDANSTDNVNPAIELWKKKHAGRCEMVVVLFGKATNAHVFQELTDRIYYFDRIDPKAYKDLFRWVSSSLKTLSLQVVEETYTVPSPPATENINREMKKDPWFLVVLARCTKSKKSYLIKYAPSGNGDYSLMAAYGIRDEYYELCDDNRWNFGIRLGKLKGNPCCPHCGNVRGLTVCGCGMAICSSGTEEELDCAWCNKRSNLGPQIGEVEVKLALG